MAPDRVNSDNVVWIVGDHERRLSHLEERTEDLAVLRRDLAELKREFGEFRDEIRANMGSLQALVTRAAVTVATSSLIFAATLWAVFK